MEMMSSEELKIRGELEMDVERELEEEIKEGICHLAFRLQRLYQQQKERNEKEVSEFGVKCHQRGTAKNKILSEVNINIKMEGGTKIEIKEIKKQQPRENRFGSTPKAESVRGGIMAAPPSNKQFDWTKSLRSGPSSRIDCSHQSRVFSNQAKTSASLQRKVNMGVNKKVQQLA